MYRFFTLCGENLYISDRYFRVFMILFSFAQIPPNEIAVFCIGISINSGQLITWTCMRGHSIFSIVVGHRISVTIIIFIRIIIFWIRRFSFAGLETPVSRFI